MPMIEFQSQDLRDEEKTAAAQGLWGLLQGIRQRRQGTFISDPNHAIKVGKELSWAPVGSANLGNRCRAAARQTRLAAN